jgi:site-specific DNA-methyltransferase (adenine-specific)
MILRYNSAHGDLWQGDCLKVMKILSIMPDFKPFDAIITDPPYGTTACKWDSVIPFAPMWALLNKLIKPNGAVVLFGSEPFSSALRMSNIKNYKYDWIWEKSHSTGHLNAYKRPMIKHEVISIFYKKQCIYVPQISNKIKKNIRPYAMNYSKHIYGAADIHQSKTRKIPRDKMLPNSLLMFNTCQDNLHPTQKPVALMEYLIRTYTNEGERVLDFTSGSGTTGVACIPTGRKFTMIELDDENKYIDISIKRLQEATI